ncbi:hypothetical protein ACWDTT_15955 [Streptosporangium sandarakinum]
MKRTTNRAEFLADVLTTAVEHDGYGFFSVREWKHDGEPGERYAVIYDPDEKQIHRIDGDTIAAGIGVIRRAQVREDARYKELALHNTKTGQRLYMPNEQRGAILRANHANDAGGLDVIDALAIVECALFGAVTYA